MIIILDTLGLEAFVAPPPGGRGRSPEDRPQIAHAFVAKAVLAIPTTAALIERLAVDRTLRRICGWERRSDLPSESTFSRAFAEFAAENLPERVHEQLVREGLRGRIVGHIARDATEIEARERPSRCPYEAFPACEAHRVLRRLEFHFTSKHASWLNMVEIEIGVLRTQCLDRRIAERERLEAEIAAWQRRRNAEGARINWMFTTDQAREKMGRAYPDPNQALAQAA